MIEAEGAAAGQARRRSARPVARSRPARSRRRRDWCDLHDVVASAAAHLRHRSPDRVRAPGRPAAGARRRGAARAGVLEPDRERGQVLAPERRRSGSAAARRSGRVTVRVTDRGRGIPHPVPRARVRAVLPRPRRGSGSGSGLGLAICRGFVEANGGRIVLQAGSRTRHLVRGQLPGRCASRRRRRG